MAVTSEQIKQAHSKLMAARPLIDENERYVRGENPYIMPWRRAGQYDPNADVENEAGGSMTYHPGMTQPRRNDDNRVPIPLAKNAVTDLTGYAARPGDINVEWLPMGDEPEDDAGKETVKKETREFNTSVDAVEEFNESDITTSELYSEVLTQGKAFELVYFDPEQSDFAQYAKLPTRETVVGYSKDIKPKIVAGFWFKDAKTVEVYEAKKTTTWTKAGSSEDWTAGDEVDNPFAEVPVVEYIGNNKRMSLFQAEKGIIDAYDKLLSSSVNEVDRFNALIALFPGKVTPEFIAALKNLKAIDDLGKYDTWPQYLEKSLEKINEYYNNLADRLERLFHKSVKIPDMSDENFAGNASGVAIAFKLIGLEFQASMVDTYFDRGLAKRYELIAMVPDAPATGEWKMAVQHSRNMPTDEATKIDSALKLSAIVSKETLLRFLPAKIVDDVMKELERLEADAPDVDLDNLPGPGAAGDKGEPEE